MGHDSTPGEFGAALRRLREERALTQEELAARSGITAKAIGVLERGERRRPYPHTVRALADALDLAGDARASLIAAVPGHAAAAPVAPAAPAMGPGPFVAAGALIGRAREVAELRALLAGGPHRLVTLTGTGGVGKTRLALEVLALESGRFPGGAAAVDLAPVRQAVPALPRIASALGLPDLVGDDPQGELARLLAGPPVLVVLDNLEQVAGIGTLVAELLTRCPALVVLATSRAPLRIRAEHEYAVAPLALPVGSGLDAVAASPAVALLLERAGAAGRGLPRTAADAAALAEICRRLDGLPLGLELAAAGLRVLTPAMLADRLGEVALGDGPADLPARHRTMDSVLEWSMDLLEPEEIGLFARLSVFVGGFTLAAAEAVAAAGTPTPEALLRLVEQSLVVRVPSPGPAPRFRMLEPVRRYAMARLHAAGDAASVASVHADFYVAQGLAAADALEGALLVPTLDLLEEDHGNVRAAYLRLIELDRDNDAAELAGRLWPYLALRGHAHEGLEWLGRVGAGVSDATRCHVAAGRLGLLLLTGDHAAMAREAEGARAAVGRVRDPAVTCAALTLLAQAEVFAGRLDVAARTLDDAEARAREAGRPWVAAHARIARCQLALAAGDLAVAAAEIDGAVRDARETGNPFTLATALNVHATLAEVQGDEHATAVLLGESIALSLDGRLSWTLGYALPALAGLAGRAGDLETAAWLFGAAAAVSIADAVDPTFPAARVLADRGLARTRATLAPATFAAAWAAGRAADAQGIGARSAEVIDRAGAARSA
ncbi:ATP-binding protein [Demequina iriomotensis]|uniref:ATP-binding protein n=1 Tax=Demequina iriomotensis TaxID=1536641 RepID=UPI000780F634|nr:helix-turn-helix domain-containing protein [Demequina iriomotensis]